MRPRQQRKMVMSGRVSRPESEREEDNELDLAHGHPYRGGVMLEGDAFLRLEGRERKPEKKSISLAPSPFGRKP